MRIWMIIISFASATFLTQSAAKLHFHFHTASHNTEGTVSFLFWIAFGCSFNGIITNLWHCNLALHIYTSMCEIAMFSLRLARTANTKRLLFGLAYFISVISGYQPYGLQKLPLYNSSPHNHLFLLRKKFCWPADPEKNDLRTAGIKCPDSLRIPREQKICYGEIYTFLM